MKRSLCWTLILATSALCGGAIKAETIEDEGWWTAVFSQGDIEMRPGEDSRLRWWFDGHARFQDDADGFNVSIVRPGVGYKLTDAATIWAGYAWIRTSPIGGNPDFDENRIWQQITWSTELGDWRVGLRPRLEQRFVETGDDPGWRFRQFASARAPVSGGKKLTFVAWDEVFIHLNNTDFGARSGFNQNRVFVGFGWNQCPDASSSRVEVGYLNQYINGVSTDRMHHLLAVNFFLQ